MSIEFSKISLFERGTLLELLKDAYSFDRRYEQSCLEDWQEFDIFFFDNLQIADKYGFMTTLHGKAIGFVSWDPRQMPRYAEIGHNCIATAYKGKGYSTLQLQEAVDRILRNEVGQIRVTTNDDLIPAQRMYECVGFVLQQKRHMGPDSVLKGEHWDYVYRV
ncbi:GNAT family N-acetyltransferase [Paenibacillus sp. FSL H3-0333]|uniref:GNAT family N-acetyltransferase n=1 Tax=Paenibacillus sp. FSL H3-0333 TaxID=2921373 RepID=UPI0030F63EE5